MTLVLPLDDAVTVVAPFDLGIRAESPREAGGLQAAEATFATMEEEEGVEEEELTPFSFDLKDFSTDFGSSFTLTNSLTPLAKSSFWREDKDGAEGCLAMWTTRPLWKKNWRPQNWQ